MATDQFLDLLGIRDITVNGGSTIARRERLNIIGGDVEDVDGVTQVTFANVPVWNADAIPGTVDLDDYSPDNFAAMSDLEITMVADLTITGLDSTGVTQYIKRVWNGAFSGFPNRTLSIAHNDSNSLAANRIFCPGGTNIALTVGQLATVFWSESENHWRAIPCSA